MALHGYFDTIHGSSAYGWAWDDESKDDFVRVEAVCSDGRVLGAATADLFRGDLLTAGYGVGGFCAFKLELPGPISQLVGKEIAIRVVGTDIILGGSPIPVRLNPNIERLLNKQDRVAQFLPRLRSRLDREVGPTAGISIVMPVYNSKAEWLIEAIESIIRQWCSHWELICVDDGSSQEHVGRILFHYAVRDQRIRVLRSRENVGIARATNYGLRAAKYDYIAFMDHDDYLEPDAVWRLLRSIARMDADLVYSDEVVTSSDIDNVLDFRARPAFSHDYYLSHPYFVHMVCVRKTIAYGIGGYNESMNISADVDFILRVIEQSRAIVHVPNVLYRWRTHATSAGHSKKQAVMNATIGALQGHLDRLNTGATAHPGLGFNQFRIDWPRAEGKTLIIIPTKNGARLLRQCVQSIEKTVDRSRYKLVIIDHESDDPRAKRLLGALAKRHTVMPYKGPFNFSDMNNVAVQKHKRGCEFICFMNNDVEAIDSGWLDRLTSLADRRNVGAVAPLLLFGSKKIQHAGVIIGFSGAAEHVGKHIDVSEGDGRRNGPNCIYTSVRDYSAVTAACMVVKISTFDEIRGFDKRFAVGFNDTDLCLRIRSRGYKVLYDGHTVLFHHESATRSKTNDLVHAPDNRLLLKRWRNLMAGWDPFYSPVLSLETEDHVLAEALQRRVFLPRLVDNYSHAKGGKPPTRLVGETKPACRKLKKDS